MMFCISWPALVCIYSNTDTAQKWEPFQTWLNTNELIDPAPHVGLPTRNRTYLEWPGLLRPASFSSTNRKALFWTIFNCLLRLKRIWTKIAGIALLKTHDRMMRAGSRRNDSPSQAWIFSSCCHDYQVPLSCVCLLKKNSKLHLY